MSDPRWEAATENRELLRASPYWGVHASRYLFAAPRTRGHRVLDVACGTGFGIDILLDGGAGTVVGVELDPRAAWQAARGSRPGAHVVQADCRQLPFVASSFAVATSFETLEHLVERSTFLSELRRVLEPGGVLLLSTPNALVTLPQNGKPANPYHVHEYAPAELLFELQSHFTRVELLCQRLEPRFAVPPFWDEQQRMPRTPAAQARLRIWRALNWLPLSARDLLSRVFLGQPFLPDAQDYVICPEGLEGAPVLMAICQAGLEGATHR